MNSNNVKLQRTLSASMSYIALLLMWLFSSGVQDYQMIKPIYLLTFFIILFYLSDKQKTYIIFDYKYLIGLSFLFIAIFLSSMINENGIEVIGRYSRFFIVFFMFFAYKYFNFSSKHIVFLFYILFLFNNKLFSIFYLII